MSDQWNVGKTKKSGLQKKEERAVIVGLAHQYQTLEKVEEYLDELEFLAMTAGAVTVKRFIQKLTTPDRRTFIGSGKVAEIEEYIEANDIDLVIFDDDLSGKQTNILEEALKRKIVDRTTLILDIFAARAQTAQAKTQVELAQMQYLLPRLRGLWTHLERQRGGIGMRGPGEQEIETDRRIVRDKISLLKKKLSKIDLQNQTRRKQRGQLIRVALVGYTNVGKSTIMNVLSKSDVFAENKLFATLDTTIRKIVFERMPFLLSDTVGFIRKLPHHLVESFKSTLDEVRESEILVHVVDVAHPQFEDHMQTVQATLKDIDALDKPTLIVLNKMDLYRAKYYDQFLEQNIREQIESELLARISEQYEGEAILLSAKTKENLPELRTKLTELVQTEYHRRYPYQVKSW